MGGIVVFKWDEQRITVLQNRDNWEARVISKVHWEEDQELLVSWDEWDKFHMTWFGVSKEGRFAFLVDSALYDDDHGVNDVWEAGAAVLTSLFLVSHHMNPQQFAQAFERGLTDKENPEPEQRELTYTYNLIVGDIKSKSIYHIFKPVKTELAVHIQNVDFGVHTLSSHGLDSAFPKDARLRYLFSDNIDRYENDKISLEMLAEIVMCDRDKTVEGDEMSAIFVETRDYHPVSQELGKIRYGTASRIAFSVNSFNDLTVFGANPISEVIMYETSFPRHIITFNTSIDHA